MVIPLLICTHMDCSCPYAEDGKHCKHMAAVLYEYERKQTDGLVEPSQPSLTTNQLDYQKIIHDADPKLVHSFLIGLLKANHSLAMDFLTAIHYGYTQENISIITDSIERLINSVGYYNEWDRYDEIEDYSEFRSECNNLIERLIRPLQGQHNHGLTIKCTTYFIQALNGLDYEVQEWLDDVYTKLSDIIESELNKGSQQLRKDTLDWVLHWRNMLYCDLSPLLTHCFTDTDSLLVIQEDLLKKLDEIKSKRYEEDDWIEAYATKLMINLIDTYPDVMMSYEDFVKRYDGCGNVKLDHIQRLMNQHQYDPALQLILSLNPKDLYGSINDQLDDWLIEIYEYNHDLSHLRDIYYDRLMDFHWGINMKCYHGYKDTFSELEWFNHRDTIIEQLKDRSIIDEVYCEENMVEPLMIMVKDSSSASLLLKYTSLLDGFNHQAVLELYQHHIEMKAAYAGGKDHYEELAQLLDRLSEFKDGQTIASQLANNISTIHKARRNMIAAFKAHHLID